MFPEASDDTFQTLLEESTVGSAIMPEESFQSAYSAESENLQDESSSKREHEDLAMQQLPQSEVCSEHHDLDPAAQHLSDEIRGLGGWARSAYAISEFYPSGVLLAKVPLHQPAGVMPEGNDLLPRSETGMLAWYNGRIKV